MNQYEIEKKLQLNSAFAKAHKGALIKHNKVIEHIGEHILIKNDYTGKYYMGILDASSKLSNTMFGNLKIYYVRCMDNIVRCFLGDRVTFYQYIV